MSKVIFQVSLLLLKEMLMLYMQSRLHVNVMCAHVHYSRLVINDVFIKLGSSLLGFASL